MTPNERLERGADLLRTHAADMAALLDGVRLNNPDNPRQVDPDPDPYEDEWYNIVGTPDFAYGRALKIADAAIHAATIYLPLPPPLSEEATREMLKGPATIIPDGLMNFEKGRDL